MYLGICIEIEMPSPLVQHWPPCHKLVIPLQHLASSLQNVSTRRKVINIHTNIDDSCCPDTGGAVQPVSPGCGTRHCFPVKLNGKISPWVRTMSGLGYTLTIPPTRPHRGGGGGRGGFLWGAQGECLSCL